MFIKKIKNNKGDTSALNFIVILSIIIVCLCFIVDMVSFVKVKYAFTKEVNYLAGICSSQGGFLSDKPAGYPSTITYIKRSEALQEWNNFVEENDLKDSEISFGSKTLDFDSSFTYQSDVKIVASANFTRTYLKWIGFSNFTQTIKYNTTICSFYIPHNQDM